MATFNELLRHMPGRLTVDYLGGVPENDPIVTYYNRFWGVATNTHCGRTADGVYVITGSFVNRQNDLLRVFGGMFYQAVQFPCSWFGVMRKNGLAGHVEDINGQPAYVMTRVPENGLCKGCCDVDATTNCQY